MTAYRYRRCPACRAAFPAGELRPLKYGAHWNKRGGCKRRCPRCGVIGFTQDFPVSKNAPAAHARGCIG